VKEEKVVCRTDSVLPGLILKFQIKIFNPFFVKIMTIFVMYPHLLERGEFLKKPL